MAVQTRLLDKQSADDMALLTSLVDSYARDAMGGGRPLQPAVYQRLGAAFAAQPATFAVVAEDGGNACGVAVCVLGFSTFYAMPLVNLHDLAVLPGARGKGVGRILLAAVESEAMQRGACKVTLEVRPDNLIARNLYESMDFELSALGGQAYLMMEKVVAEKS